MKVIYKEAVLDEIAQARRFAMRERKAIDHIKLTEEEISRLFWEMEGQPVSWPNGIGFLNLNELKGAVSAGRVTILGVKLGRFIP